MAKSSKNNGKGNGQKSSKGKINAQRSSGRDGKATLDNCYREGGGYWASVQALRSLGIGKLHPFAKIVPAVRKAMGDGFKAFAAKPKRNKKTGRDTDGKILTNVSVTARADYGKNLRDIGYEVRWDGREKMAGLFKLNGK